MHRAKKSAISNARHRRDAAARIIDAGLRNSNYFAVNYACVRDIRNNNNYNNLMGSGTPGIGTEANAISARYIGPGVSEIDELVR